MQSTEVKELLHQAGDYAKKKSIDQWDFIFKKSRSLSLSAQGGEIDKHNSSLTQSFGVRIIHNQKIAIAYSEKCDLPSLKKIIDEALENSQFSDINENQNISSEDLEPICVELENSKLSDQTILEKMKLTLTLETEVKKREPLAVAAPYNGYSDFISENYYLNSLGKYCFQENKYNYCYTSALLKDGNHSSSYHCMDIAHDFNKLMPEHCISESIKNAKGLLYGKKLKTGSYSVIFTPDMLKELFGAFLGAFSGKAAQKKTSPLAEKCGQKLFNSHFSITDLPYIEGAIHHYHFDDEGYKCKPLKLIENGVLKSFIHNTETAKHFKTQTTGHASRGPKTALGVGTHVLSISPGTLEDSEVKNHSHLKVYQLAGTHSGVNLVTGDFSLGAKGYYYEGSEMKQAVADITLSGNFYKMLDSELLIGNQVYWDSEKSFLSPLILFPGLSIAGD